MRWALGIALFAIAGSWGCTTERSPKPVSSSSTADMSNALSTALDTHQTINFAAGIVLQSQGALIQSLVGALERGGYVEAVDHCHLQALSLTDSLQRSMGVGIRRLTDRPRNPDNRAFGEAAAYIENARKQVELGALPMQVEPAMFSNSYGSAHRVFFPIGTHGMCVKCHGHPGTDIVPDVWAALKARYPADEAHGFGPNDLRGIWEITVPADRVPARAWPTGF